MTLLKIYILDILHMIFAKEKYIDSIKLDLSKPPSGDYFTSQYSGLWDRDIPLIINTNVCLVLLFCHSQ